MTITGELLFVVVPSAKIPYELSPQQEISPVFNKAQEKSLLLEIETAVLFTPKSTETGEFLLLLELSPNWPLLFLPQQETEPSSRITQ